MSTTRNLLRAMLLAAIAAVAVAGSAVAQSLPDVVRIGYQRSSVLTAVLKANGTLEAALAPLGVRVTWHEFTSGVPLVEALNLDNIDFSADVADTVPIFAQAAGARLVYVAEEAPSPSAQAVLVPATSPIATLADLKGKTVAVTKGAGSHYLLIVALEKAGLGFKDISPAYLTSADGQAAFASGKVDAWVTWDPFLASAEALSGARILADGTGLANYKRYYLTSGKLAANGGKVIGVIFDALRRTGTWVKSEPAAAAKLLGGLWGIDPAIVEKANARRSYAVGPVSREDLAEQQKIADAFFAEGLIPKRVDAADAAIWQPQ